MNVCVCEEGDIGEKEEMGRNGMEGRGLIGGNGPKRNGEGKTAAARRERQRGQKGSSRMRLVYLRVGFVVHTKGHTHIIGGTRHTLATGTMGWDDDGAKRRGELMFRRSGGNSGGRCRPANSKRG